MSIEVMIFIQLVANAVAFYMLWAARNALKVNEQRIADERALVDRFVKDLDSNRSVFVEEVDE